MKNNKHPRDSERNTHWSAYKYKDWVDYSERNLVFVSVRLSAEWLTDEENKTIKTQIKSNNKIHINNTNKLRNVYLSLMMGKVSTWGISKIKTLTVLFLNRMCKYWKKCSNSVQRNGLLQLMLKTYCFCSVWSGPSRIQRVHTALLGWAACR